MLNISFYIFINLAFAETKIKQQAEALKAKRLNSKKLRTCCNMKFKFS